MKAASVEKAKKYKPKKQPLKKRLVRYWPLYVMLIPCIIYYALICYVPMAGSVLAFKDYSFKKGIWGSPWIGLKYFKTFFSSYDAPRLIKNTLTVGVIKCILEFPFAIILALLLNELRSMKFKKISQTITYLPHFLSSVIIVTMLQRILAPSTGVLNQTIAALGGDGSTFFLMEAKYFLEKYRMGFHHVSGSNQFRRPGIVRGSRDGRMRKTGKNVAYHTAGYPGNDWSSVYHGSWRTAFFRCRTDLAVTYTW